MSPMPKSGNEQSRVKPKVRALLTKWDWFWWGNAAGPFGRNGISDISALKHHVFMVVETKFNYNKPNAQQIGFLNSVEMNGGFAFVVNETTLGWLEIWLAKFEEATKLNMGKLVIPDEVGGPLFEATRELTNYPRDIDEVLTYKEAARKARETGED